MMMVKIQLSDIWTFYRFCAFAEKVGINKSWSYKSRIKKNQSFLQTFIFLFPFRKPAISNKELFWTKKSKFKISKVYKDRD